MGASFAVHARRGVVWGAFAVYGLVSLLPALGGVELLDGAQAGAAQEPTKLVVMRPVPAAELRPGDVISFADEAAPERRVSERVVAVARAAEVRVTTQGAGGLQREWGVSPGQRVARTVAELPWLGIVVTALRSPAAMAAGLLVALGVLAGPWVR